MIRRAIARRAGPRELVGPARRARRLPWLLDGRFASGEDEDWIAGFLAFDGGHGAGRGRPGRRRERAGGDQLLVGRDEQLIAHFQACVWSALTSAI
jgi:hypothetical protein